MEGCASGLFGSGPVNLSEGLQILINEHLPLRKSLETLSSLCNKVEAEGEKEAVFNQLLQVVKEFNDHSQQTSIDMVKNAALVKNAYTILIDHFSKEEQVLYPMAERMFTEEEKELLKQKVTQ